MKELKIRIGVNNDNQIVFMEPVKKVAGKTVETQIVTARLLTQEDIDREIRETMQDGCRVYKRVAGRKREIR